MEDSKKSILIARNDTATLFKIFGFETFSIDTMEPKEILSALHEMHSQLGIIIRTSEVSFSDKHEQFLQNLDVPMITIPVRAGEGNVAAAKFERLVEKAVGMKLDFLKE